MSVHDPKPLRSASPRPSRRTSAAAFAGDPPDADDPLLGFAPYVHAAPRRNSITPDRQRAFIAALAASGIVTQAAREIGASLEALYRLRHRGGAEGFSAAWDMALDRGIARLEDCALERALLGEERPVVSMGQVVTTWRRYDTALIVFLLKQRRRERFDASGAGLHPGGPAWRRLRAQWEAEREVEESEGDVLAALDEKLGRMRDNWLRQEAIANGQPLDTLALEYPRPGELGYAGDDDAEEDAEWEEGDWTD